MNERTNELVLVMS